MDNYEYSYRKKAFLKERMTGIEPASSAWEADVLPLNHTRKNLSNVIYHNINFSVMQGKDKDGDSGSFLIKVDETGLSRYHYI